MKSFKEHYTEKQLQEEGIGNFLKGAALSAGLALGTPAIGHAQVTANMLFPQIVKHEKLTHHVYMDTKNHPTIGIGVNLDNMNNRKTLAKMGVDVNALIKGKIDLNDNQVRQLYDINFNRALADAKKFIPTLNSLPLNVQKAIIDMSFNIGYNKLSQFTNLKDALTKRDFKRAAHEMMNSLWARQVKTRAVDLANMVKTAS